MTDNKTELTEKGWNAISAMAAGLPCPAKSRTITYLLQRGYIAQTKHGWYVLTDSGRAAARGK